MKDKIIFFYNIFTTLFIPSTITLCGIWNLEIREYRTEYMGALPMGILLVFLPEVIFGLKWGLGKKFTVFCSTIWFLLIVLFSYYYFMVKAHAIITFSIIILLLCVSFIWSIVIEYCDGLKTHILKYPQDQWIVPCTEDEALRRCLHLIWCGFTVVGTVFLIVVG